MEQGTFDFADATAPALPKLCECGCGGAAPIARITNRSRGAVAGQPQRFIRGHHSKLAASQLEAERRAETAGADVKLCECECGLPAPIATMTRKAKGHVKGQPVRFIAGHKPGTQGPKPKLRTLFVEVGQEIGKSVVTEAEVITSCPSKPMVRSVRLRCKCGTEYLRTITHVFRNPGKESCGCQKFGDIAGRRFGDLTALERVGSTPDGKKRTGLWLCICDCKNEATVPRKSLMGGHARNCGCERQRGLPLGEAAFNAVFRGYQAGARARGLSWELAEEDFRRLTSLNCAYCSAAPGTVSKGYPGSGDFTYNGLDRVDNSQGYLMGNVVPACKTCNYNKRDQDFNDWQAWSARFAAFQTSPEMIPANILAAQLAVQLKAAA